MSNWMDSLKAGDKVVVSHGYGAGARQIREVLRVTKTMVVAGTDRFRRKDGRMIGRSGWPRVMISEYTDEVAIELAREKEEAIAKRRLFELYDRRNYLSDAEMDWLIKAMREIESISDAEDE